MTSGFGRVPRLFGLAAIAFAATMAGAQAQGRVGMLQCDVGDGVGVVVTSSKSLNCMFQPDYGPPEMYVGTINRFGLDIGFTGPGKLAWGVLAPGSSAPGALQGVYGGVGGGLTVGAGATGNLLIGGGANISLQPLSISGQTGLNLNAGIGQISLQYVPPQPPRRKKWRKHRRYYR